MRVAAAEACRCPHARMRATSDLLLVVAAALITRRGTEPHVLLAERPPGKRYAGALEFPGGKLEAGESPEQGLARELREELAIEIDPKLLVPLTFSSSPGSLGSKHLLIPLFTNTDDWVGEPRGNEGQRLYWATADELDDDALMRRVSIADLPMVQARAQQRNTRIQ